ncbi:src-like-adapter 2 [Hemiscyllium ocellatum]|uniref:src-like-adapter 2 n=1 Tax=Hemiscyllium ocellatum TaxID=170820 RepID=UPI00296668BC|nr:src-like-adapter 2 [Hemiscyllium ocellatum]
MGSRPSKCRHQSMTMISSNPTNQLSPDISKVMTVVALYNYPSTSDTEPVISVGERLNVVSEEGDWWKVVSLATGKECHIPCNYAAKVYHRWLFEGISREKAEELLLLPSNRSGAFMIRESQTRKGSYSLSVRRSNNASWDSIKHYRIHRLPNGWFYISPRLTVPSLHDMVDYYSECGEGLCCTLKEPCHIQGPRVAQQHHPDPIMVQNPQLNWNEVDSSVLISDNKESGEESPVSMGLREAINSYLFMTEEMDLDKMSDKTTRLKTLQARLQSSQRHVNLNTVGNLGHLNFNSAGL